VTYNPWGKKNPFLSMWLSGANAVLGVGRNQITAATRRQTNAAISEGARQALAFWGIASPVKMRRVKRRRR
jgi:hypothetical protein